MKKGKRITTPLKVTSHGKDLTGLTFSRLTVIGPSPEKSDHRGRKWLVYCVCNRERILTKYTTDLTSENKRIHSCGCLKKEMAEKHYFPLTHGKSRTSFYRVWKSMLLRCNKSTHKSYEDYGGRGITVCEEWSDFKNFDLAMGDSYRKELKLERINNDLGYCPENCRWATPKEQAANRRNTVFLILNGEKISFPEAMRTKDSLGLGYSTIAKRLQSGWTADKDFTTILAPNSPIYKKKSCD